MPEAAIGGPIVSAIILGLVLSLAVEALLAPRPSLRHRPLASWGHHVGSWLILFALELALFARPYNAAANVLALELFVVLISNAKFHSLREPFIYQDSEYFVDALRHPRLYLPFLGAGRAVGAVVAITGGVYGGLMLEAPVLTPAFSVQWAAVVGGLLALGGLFLYVGVRRPPRVTLDPAVDLQRLGLFSSLWRYGCEERQRIDPPASPLDLAGVPTFRPNILAIQSESFFDARRLMPEIRREVLAEFDRISHQALRAGRLRVPAWGANTVRTEFEFLSGLNQEALGIHRFNPYRKLAPAGVETLASTLKRHGYRTICVHPYPASFYQRATVLPILGFDEFMDLDAFREAPRDGPYVSDQSVTEKVMALLDAADQPLFVFVITMENHGPLHLESVAAGDVERLYSSPPPDDCADLTIYLRHLANADRMIGTLHNGLAKSGQESILCFYGDHMPIMPKVYAQLDLGDQRTDYFLWTNRSPPMAPARRDLAASDLAKAILELLAAMAECAGTEHPGKTPENDHSVGVVQNSGRNSRDKKIAND